MILLIAGDFCPHDRVVPIIEEGRYKELWNNVPDITKGADYSILNLECPVVEHQTAPIDKCGPNLKCSVKAIDAIKYAGFDCVTLANNHFYDYGEVGVEDTLSTLQKNKVDYVGGGVNLHEASRILYKVVDGKKLAIVNCCEHEFSIATEATGGSNPLNPIRQYYAIQEARRNADRVLVIVHGGIELFWLPSKRMIETYRFFIDAGADAIIDHHQHCYSGYEVYKGKPIFYGIGNFCFDWEGKRNDKWNEGYMVRLTLNDVVAFELIPYIQCNERIGVYMMEKDECNKFFHHIKELNRLIADARQSEILYQSWCKETQKTYINILNPLYNRFTKSIFDSFIGKILINKRKWLHTKDILINESHIERLCMFVEDNMRRM